MSRSLQKLMQKKLIYISLTASKRKKCEAKQLLANLKLRKSEFAIYIYIYTQGVIKVVIVTLANRITQLAVSLDACSSRSLSLSLVLPLCDEGTEYRVVIEFLENFGRDRRRACPVPACQLRNRDLTVVTCSVSTIVRRTKRGIQSGCDDGLHDGRTGGQHDAPAAWRSCLPQSVPLSGVLWTSLIKVCITALML